MIRNALFIHAAWSSNKDGGCMTEFNDPLFQFAYRRADELKELLLKETHSPDHHITRTSIQVIADLSTSVLKYDVSGCCEPCEEIIERLINKLDHSACNNFEVRLNFTYRQSIEQFINGSIARTR